MPHGATALSRPPVVPDEAARRDRPAAAVARASLCVLLAMPLPACLVTSSPSFEEPERTPPFLLASTAEPDLRQFLIVDTSGPQPPPYVFRAEVRSEDNDQQLLGRLVLDYGVQQPQTMKPYSQALHEEAVTIEPGTLDSPPRYLQVTWFTKAHPAPVGCHTVTLFATHEIDPVTGCPTDPEDFDFLTWNVLVCDGVQSTCCDPEKPAEDGGCAALQCPAIDENIRCHAPLDAGGAP